MSRIIYSYPEWQYLRAAPYGSKKENPSQLEQTAATTGLIFLHECGHALAATLLYQNANPKINVTFPGGVCHFNNTYLSSLGSWFGRSNSAALVAAAGPIVDIISMLAITKLTRSKKYAAQLMSWKAFGLALYSLSALVHCYDAHDFCQVRSHGGQLAYGLLAAACLATSTLVLHNAKKTPEIKTPIKPRINQPRLVLYR